MFNKKIKTNKSKKGGLIGGLFILAVFGFAALGFYVFGHIWMKWW